MVKLASIFSHFKLFQLWDEICVHFIMCFYEMCGGNNFKTTNLELISEHTAHRVKAMEVSE